ncbi:hypothetical protein GPS56_15860 [Acinetobacter haemolyticus]|nr:hypothetical protein [Acinetobacter haemolyticus]
MLGENHHFLKKFSISDAAIAYKKPRSTILKYLCTRQISQNPYPIRILPS